MCLSCIIEQITGFDLSTDEGHDALSRLRRIPWPTATDEMIECAAYVRALYENPAGDTGGPLHIVTDDNNVEDSHLSFCRELIGEWTGYDCWPEQEHRAKVISGWILDLMEPMDVIQRQVTLGLGHGDLAEHHGHVFMPSTEFPIREDVLDDDGNRIGWQWGFRTRRVEAQ
jgi:hypothetical protein